MKARDWTNEPLIPACEVARRAGIHPNSVRKFVSRAKIRRQELPGLDPKYFAVDLAQVLSQAVKVGS